jgi:hypothetical protein
MESQSAKVWLDSLGVIHRMDTASQAAESVVIDYDPTGADRVWTVPVTPTSSPSAPTYEQLADAHLAKAIPADHPITTISAAGREFKLLSLTRVRDDLVILCTTTDLLPPARAHRDQTGERWQATQLFASGPSNTSWSPSVMARLHTPYREITWYAVGRPKDCPDPDYIDLLVQLGQPGNAWTMESWLDQQPNPARLHSLVIDALPGDHVDLDTHLHQIYAIFESYRSTVGEAGKEDFITASDTWETFKATADNAISGHQAIISSGR